MESAAQGVCEVRRGLCSVTCHHVHVMHVCICIQLLHLSRLILLCAFAEAAAKRLHRIVGHLTLPRFLSQGSPVKLRCGFGAGPQRQVLLHDPPRATSTAPCNFSSLAMPSSASSQFHRCSKAALPLCSSCFSSNTRLHHPANSQPTSSVYLRKMQACRTESMRLKLLRKASRIVPSGG